LLDAHEATAGGTLAAAVTALAEAEQGALHQEHADDPRRVGDRDQRQDN